MISEYTDSTNTERTNLQTGSKTWRPIRDLLEFDENDDQIKKLQTKVTPAVPAGTTQIVAGAPGNLSAIFATQSPAKQQNKTYSLVSVSFNVIPSASYSNTRIWITGYKGNPNPVLQTAGASGPINFLLEATQETITITGQPVSQDGHVIDLSQCVSTTVTLSGVVTAPPAPAISQTLVAIPLGYQFSYTQLNLGATQDVIDSYRVYRNSVNNSGTATLLRVIKHDPKSSNAVVVQDVTGGNQTFYYWVSSVNTVALESALTNAQTGAVVSGTANIDNDVSDAVTFARGTFLEKAGGVQGQFSGASVNVAGGYIDVTNNIGAPAAIGNFITTSTTFNGVVQVEADVWSNGSGNLIDFLLYAGSGASGVNGYMLRFDSRNGLNPGQIILANNGALALIGTAKGAANGSNLAAGWHHLTGISYGDGHFDVLVDGVWQYTAFDTTFTTNNVIGYCQEASNGRIRNVQFSHPANGGNGPSVLLNNKANAVGSTSGPATNSGVFSVLAEMTQTITTKGNKVLATFHGVFFEVGGICRVSLALFRDGVQISDTVAQDLTAANLRFTVSLTWIDSPSAGSHTYDIRWLTNANTVTNDGTSRSLQVVELG